MSGISLIAVSLFIVEQLSYIIASYLIILQYKRTKYLAYLSVETGFIMAAISSILRFSTSLMMDETKSLVLFRYGNFLILTAITLWFLGFFYFRFDKLPAYSLFVTYLGGFSAAAFIFSSQVKVYWDEATKNWNAQYPFYFFIFIGPLIFIGILEIITPLFLKAKMLRLLEEKKALYFMGLGLSLVLFWGVLSLFTFIPWVRFSRPFLLPLGWLIWSIGAYKEPLLLSFTTARPLTLFVVNEETSATLYIYRFDKKIEQKYSEELVGMLFSALSTATTEILGEEGNQKIYQLEEKLVIQKRIPKTNLSVYLMTINFDRSLMAALNYFAYLIQQRKEISSIENANLKSELEHAFGSLAYTKPMI